MSETTDKKIQPISTQEDREFEITIEKSGPFELYQGFYKLLNKYGDVKPYIGEPKISKGKTKHAIQANFQTPVIQRENKDEGTIDKIVLKGKTDMYFVRRPFDPTKLSLPFGSAIHLEIIKEGGKLDQKRGHKAYTHSIVLYPDQNIHTFHIFHISRDKPRDYGLPGKMDDRQKTKVLLKAMQYLESVYQ